MLSRDITAKKKAPKGCLALFGLPFLAGGLFFLCLGGIAPIVGYVRSGSWAEVPCTVVSAEVLESHGESTSYQPVVRYRYAYAGREYESDKLLPGWASYASDLKSSRETVAKYPAGSKAVCRVNPAEPAVCLLERRVPGLVFFIIPFSLIFVAVGGGITLGALGVFDGYAARRKARRDAEAAGRSVLAGKARKPEASKVPARVFGALFALVGGGVGFFLGVKPAWTAYSAGSWPEVPCVIEASSVGSHRGSKGGTTYSVDIRYRYEFGGRRYVSDRYEPLGGSSSGYEDKAEAVAKYPAGATAVCRVNPADPDEALLSRDLGWPVALGGGLGGVFFLVGLAVLTGRFGTTGRLPVRAVGETLRPKTGAAAGVFGMLFFALFWNGIVSLFVMQAVKGFRRGNPEWFLCVFLIPFVVVGLVLLAALAHAVLKCFAPRFEFTPAGEPVVGGTVGLRWRRAGGLSPLRSVTVALEVVETGKGTSTSGGRRDNRTTYHRIIRLEPVMTLDDGLIREDGTRQLALPDGLPPTLDLGNNTVDWRLRVRVRDGFGLSYSTEYPLTVGAAAPVSGGPVATANPFADAPLRPDADAYAPGDRVTGSVAAAGIARTVRLGWTTAGDGDVDACEVASCDIAPGATRFELSIPEDAPPSYTGKSLSILWTLELCEGDRVLATASPVVSPTRAALDTSAYEPSPDLAPWWYPWVSKLRAMAAKRAVK